MKLRWYDRILLFIVAVFMLACALLLISLPLFSDVNRDVTARISNLFTDQTGTALMIGGGVIALILAVYLICVSFARKKVSAPKSVVVRQSDVGTVEISVDAIDTLVQKSARSFSEVKDCMTQINVTQFSDVVILMRLHVMPDADIPDLTGRMQGEIKSYVENMSGINVREIKVMVESAGVNPSARVQ